MSIIVTSESRFSMKAGDDGRIDCHVYSDRANGTRMDLTLTGEDGEAERLTGITLAEFEGFVSAVREAAHGHGNIVEAYRNGYRAVPEVSKPRLVPIRSAAE